MVVLSYALSLNTTTDAVDFPDIFILPYKTEV
jgi:hypothetical protein